MNSQFIFSIRNNRLLTMLVIIIALMLSACGGGGGGGGGETRVVGLEPEAPFAYQSRGCGGTENGVVYQRRLADSSKNTTDTYVIRDTNNTHYYAKATTNGSLYAVAAPSDGSGQLLDTILGLLLPIPLPPLSNNLPQAPALTQGHTFFLGSEFRVDESNNNPLEVRVFQQGNRMYYAINTEQTCGNGDTNLSAGVFAFPSGLFAVPPNRTVFSLRDDSAGLRGFMSGKGVEIGGFRFLADDDFRYLQMEHQADLYESEDGGFSILADSGYKRWDAGMHSAIYGKLTAQHKWSEDTSLYLQSSIGDLESDFYANSLLHGYAAGVFADKVLRHNDFWHLRIEQPFSSSAAAVWQLAADVRVGTEDNYFGIGAAHLLTDDTGELLVFYRRQL